jgi:hypothetical protein
MADKIEQTPPDKRPRQPVLRDAEAVAINEIAKMMANLKEDESARVVAWFVSKYSRPVVQ